ncbi:MAG: hypothetical protein AB8G05_11700 [Oligoflexales bacterium]
MEADLQLYIWILVKSEILNQVWNHQILPQIKEQLDGERDQYSRSISKENLLHPDEKVSKLENNVKSQIYHSKILGNYFNFWSQFIVEIYSKIGIAKWEQANSTLHKLIGNEIKVLVKNEVAANFDFIYSFSSSLKPEKFQESIEISAYYFISVYHLVSWLVKFSPEYRSNVFITQRFLQDNIDESAANQLLEKLKLYMQNTNDTSFSRQLNFIRTVLN